MKPPRLPKEAPRIMEGYCIASARWVSIRPILVVVCEAFFL